MKLLKYAIKNWKLIIHLLFRTYFFGVDNRWWFPYPSIFGLPIKKRFSVKQILLNIRMMKIRANCGFIAGGMKSFE